MADEIIDLTGSPPSSSRSSEAPRISASVSSRKTQFKKAAMPSWVCPNPNHMRHTNQQGAGWVPRKPTSGQPDNLSQIVNRFQTSMHGNQVAAVYEPVTESNASLIPHRARFKEPWTPKEQELFLMGLIKYGRGHWSKIARHFVWNKTPQQVQSYATSFFRHLPSTYLHSFKRRNPTYATDIATDLMTRSENLMGSLTSYSMPIMANESLPTLSLFPDEAPFFRISPAGEASSIPTHGFQIQTGGASTSMTADGKVDLELRLG